MNCCKTTPLDESLDAPEIIEKVKSTRYSIARRYGQICAFGHRYIYHKKNDTLIRADIHQQLKTQRRQAHAERNS